MLACLRHSHSQNSQCHFITPKIHFFSILFLLKPSGVGLIGEKEDITVIMERD